MSVTPAIQVQIQALSLCSSRGFVLASLTSPATSTGIVSISQIAAAHPAASAIIPGSPTQAGTRALLRSSRCAEEMKA
jgi:hypothetical protein